MIPTINGIDTEFKGCPTRLLVQSHIIDSQNDEKPNNSHQNGQSTHPYFCASLSLILAQKQG